MTTPDAVKIFLALAATISAVLVFGESRDAYRGNIAPEVRYINIYPDSAALTPQYESRNEADSYARSDRIACKRVEFVIGQFDR